MAPELETRTGTGHLGSLLGHGIGVASTALYGPDTGLSGLGQVDLDAGSTNLQILDPTQRYHAERHPRYGGGDVDHGFGGLPLLLRVDCAGIVDELLDLEHVSAAIGPLRVTGPDLYWCTWFGQFHII